MAKSPPPLPARPRPGRLALAGALLALAVGAVATVDPWLALLAALLLLATTAGALLPPSLVPAPAPKPPLAVSREQEAAVDRFARFVVRTGLVVPAIFALESVRPLSFIGSQLMHVLSPSVTAVLSGPDWDALARLLEDRRGMEYVLRRIEDLDAVGRAAR